MIKPLRPLLLALLLGVGAFPAHADPGAAPPGAPPIPTTLRDAERELADLERRSTELTARASTLQAHVQLRERRGPSLAPGPTRASPAPGSSPSPGASTPSSPTR
jgi:hypothetical protein